MTLSLSPEYLARKKRMDDAFSLKKPDRVPVAPAVVLYYPTRVKGISNKDAMYNLEVTREAWKEAMVAHDWDAAIRPGSLHPVRPLDILGMKQFKWPGGGLADNQPLQWVEGEYMRQDEYDEMLAHPNGFAVRKIWPRISGTLAGVSGMVEMNPPLFFLSNAFTLPAVLGEILSSPAAVELLKKALELAEAHQEMKEWRVRYEAEVMQLGFPQLFAGAAIAAFDCMSDMFRGMRGVMLDMYRVPDKLLAAIEMLTPLTSAGCIKTARTTGKKAIGIALHRGAAGFMSDKQFAKFYWPSLRTLLLALIDAGLTPVPFFEGDYTPRLEYLRELPPKKVVGHFDMVDRKKAKKLLGDVMCFWGNVPASLLCTGTPQQIKDDVKDLIDTFGDTGGLIVDGSGGIPDEAKPENVRAMTEAAREYGAF